MRPWLVVASMVLLSLGFPAAHADVRPGECITVLHGVRVTEDEIGKEVTLGQYIGTDTQGGGSVHWFWKDDEGWSVNEDGDPEYYYDGHMTKFSCAADLDCVVEYVVALVTEGEPGGQLEDCIVQ